MTARTLALAALLTAALAPAAAAKEITEARLCGTEGCAALTGVSDHTMVEGATIDAPSRSAPFVELIYAFRAGETREEFVNQYLPSAGLLRLDTGYWLRVTGAERARLDRVAATLEAFPAKKLLEIAPEMPRPAAAPPADARPATAGDDDGGGGGPPLAALVIGAVLALAIAAAALSTRRRRAVPQP